MKARQRKKALQAALWAGGHYWRRCETPGLWVRVSSISTEYWGRHPGKY